MHRRRRGQQDTRHNFYSINGPEQQRTIEFSKLLQSDSFKTSFVNFLTEYFANEELNTIIGRKKIFVTNNEKCFSYEAVRSKIIRKNELFLTCYHEEADTKMIFHIFSLDSPKSVVIKANDTDVLLIMLANYHKLEFLHKVWIETGFISKNTYRFIDVSLLSNHLGIQLCSALTGFHALTGCDYTTAFFRKGKIKPFRILEKHPELQYCLSSLGSSSTIPETIINDIQELVCLFYSVEGCKSVNEARHILFQQKSKPKSNNLLENINGL
jgi:hypothetical protein